MKKIKLSRQLFNWMALLLIVFSIIVFAMFWPLFRYAIVDTYQKELQQKADQIANAINNIQPMHNRMGGYNMYLRFLYDSTQEDVWIIDTDYRIETRFTTSQQRFEDLPEQMQTYVNQLFAQQTPKISIFDLLFTSKTLLAGTQLYDNNDQIIGVVLVQTPIETMAFANMSTYVVLIFSLILGLILSFFVANWLSKKLSQPLNKMVGFVEALSLDQEPQKLEVSDNQELIRLNESLIRLSRQLDMAKEQRVTLDRLQKEFITSISHELKTPITILRGYIEAFEDQVIQRKDVDQSISAMHDQVMLMDRLIVDLLELTRLDNPQFLMDVEKHEITTIYKKVIQDYQYKAHQKQIELMVKIDSMFEQEVDPDRIYQMIAILLDNAIKFSEDHTQIKIIQNTENPKIIDIIDQGPGIDPDEQKEVFTHFYRSKKTDKPGTGLGLAIAKKIADRHNITITLSNVSPSGTRARIEFAE